MQKEDEKMKQVGIDDDELPTGELVSEDAIRSAASRPFLVGKLETREEVKRSRSTLQRAKKGGRMSSGQKSVVVNAKHSNLQNDRRYAEEWLKQQGPDPFDE